MHMITLIERFFFIVIHSSDPRLYLDIQVSQMFTYGLSYLHLLAVGSLFVVCIARIYFNSSRTGKF